MFSQMLSLVPAFPLFGAVLLLVLNRRASRAVAGGIASSMVLASALLSFGCLYELTAGAPGAVLRDTLMTWMHVGSVHADIGFLVDPLAAVMMCVVTGVGFLIHVYSVGYMDAPEDAGSVWRFFAYLNLFIFAMLLLVMGDNFLLMFVGWEGVGLCSYLLIGFWFENSRFASAGKKAFITNRVGDFSFILGLFWLFWALGDQATLNFAELGAVISANPALVGGAGGVAVTGITLLLFGGATGKSAQIPLFVWLPDAMAGPTPVSALIHAATMVTSGIYMICRLSFLFALAPATMGLIATIGAVTALLAATIAMTQNDIKKVLAYSTVSQLGYMFLGVGIGAFSAGFFHVLTHAFFKALLFLGAGAVIHACHHQQDMRRMGGLRHKMPITFMVFVVAWLAIIGFPGLSGFFSKDEILWLVWSTPTAQVGLFGADFPLPTILWLIGTLTAVLTAFYMSRLMFLTFWGRYRGDDPVAGQPVAAAHSDVHASHAGHGPQEVSPVMWMPLVVLALLSAGAGLLNLPHWMHMPQYEGWLHHFLSPVFASAPMRFDAADPSHEIPLMLGTLALIGLAVAVAARRYLGGNADKARAPGGFLWRASQAKWWVDELYDATLLRPLRLASRHVLWAVVDVQLIDGAVNGAGAAARRVAGWYGRRVQVGHTQAYALAIAVGTAGLVLWFAFSAVAS